MRGHQISKLVKNGSYKKALNLYTQNHSQKIPPSNFTFPYILKACAELQDIPHGQTLHAHLFKSGFTSKHTITDLTNMYMKMGFVNSAYQLFDEMPQPNLSILNVVVSGFCRNGFWKEGFGVFRMFCVEGFKRDSVSVASVVSGCGDLVIGVQVHCFGVKIGVDEDEFVETSIMSMYLNCGEVGLGGKVFGLVCDRSLVFYNAYLSGMERNGVVEIVLCVFKEMRGVLRERPDVVSVVSVLSACGNGKCLRFGRQVHGFVSKVELVFDVNVGTSFVDMYSKCGSWECAYGVFREMGSSKSLVTWNSMIAGMMLNDQSEYAVDLFGELECEVGLEADSATWNSMISGFSQLGKTDESFLFFRKMISCGVKPSVRCITSLLAACSSISMLLYGKEIHAYVERMKIIDDEFLSTAIIDMYMKCGQTSWAQSFFNRFDVKPNDPAFWNAMISGYGRNGNCEAAFDVFNLMVKLRVKPNLVTFSCLLSVCSHTGEVDKGFEIFRLMTIKYGLNPTLKHMSILIDLLSRSGRLHEAVELLKATTETSASVFASLLGASNHFSDTKLGEEMAERLLEMEPENPIPFVILSNIYAGQEKWKDVEKIRKLMDMKGLKKVPGLSATGVA